MPNTLWGAIYNQETVIASARCCFALDSNHNDDSFDYKIMVGVLNANVESGQIVGIKSFQIHPDSHSGSQCNGSMIFVSLLCKGISLDPNGPEADERCQVSGWGLLHVSKLMQIQISIQSK